MWKYKGPRITKTTFKKNKVGWFIAFDFKTEEAKLMKILWH